MQTRAGVGVSNHRSPVSAGREAAAKAMASMGGGRVDFVFLFATVGYHQQTLVQAVREATGGAPLCGCSGEGIIAQGIADESNFCVAVMTIASDEIQFKNTVITGLKDDSLNAGKSLGTILGGEIAKDDAICLFMFADVSINFDQFRAGLEGELALDRLLPILGGLAGDNLEYKQVYQYSDDAVVSNGVSCVLLRGRRRIAWGVNHGCVPLGGKRTVTRSEANVIYEIDGRPVLDVLKEYLDEEAIDNWQKTVLSLCIGLRAPVELEEEYGKYLIRFMPGKDDATGSVFISGEIPEGTPVWMTRRDHELIAGGVDKITAQIKKQLGKNSPLMAFHFDCAGRGKVIFREQEKMRLLARMQRELGTGVPWLGFYTLGEICPVGGGNCYHNYTAVVAVIY